MAVTEELLDNYEQDLLDTAQVLNGSAVLNGNGIVVMREGEEVPTLARKMADLDLAGKTYPSQALALANTVDGDYYTLAGPDMPVPDPDVFKSLYRNNAGAAVLVAQVPSTASITGALATVAEAVTTTRISTDEIGSRVYRSALAGDFSETNLFTVTCDEAGFVLSKSNNTSAASLSYGDEMHLMRGDMEGRAVGPINEAGYALPGGVDYDTGVTGVRLPAPEGIAALSGATPTQKVVLHRDAGVVDVSLPSHDANMVMQAHDTVTYRGIIRSAAGEAANRYQRSLHVGNAAKLFATGVSKLTIVAVYGQSWANGGLRGDAVSLYPEYPGKVMMIGKGARLTQATTSARIPFADIAGLRDLYERTEGLLGEISANGGIGRLGETPCAGLGAGMARYGLPADEAIICNSSAFGGTNITQLIKGQPLYDNLIYMLQQATLIGKIAGFGSVRVLVPWYHAFGGAYGVYEGQILQLQADITDAVQEMIGGAAEVVLYPCQPNGVTEAPVEEMLAHISQPTRVRCVGPMYPYAVGDGTHLTDIETRHMGEDNGRKIARHVWGGVSTTCLRATSAVIAGGVLTVTFEGAEGNLAFDTSVVTDPGQYGFEIGQTGGTPPTLSNFGLVGSTTMTADVTGTLGASPYLKIASQTTVGVNGPTTGRRACLRDTVVQARVDGTIGHNYVSCQRINIT
jgi:hypothetical protein